MVEDRRWRRVGRGTKGVAVDIRQRKMNKPISNTKKLKSQSDQETAHDYEKVKN